MKRHKPWIIQSLLDLDFYKLTMGYLIFLKYPWVMVKYVFKNRTVKVPLAEYINEQDLRDELDHVKSLRMKKEEVNFVLKLLEKYGTAANREAFGKFLTQLQSPDYELRFDGKNIILKFAGSWKEAIYWETIALAIINELYYRYLLSQMTRYQRHKIYREGRKRLWGKIGILKSRQDIKFSEFGTRRRFSRLWQEYVVATLASELPDTQFLGTSNVYLAMKYDLKPIGTCAHEMFMGMSGVKRYLKYNVLDAQNQVLEDWEEVYGEDLSIALTDTLGSEFFFETVTVGQALRWKGLRHDSGDPFAFGDRAIRFYQSLGIDPMKKTIVFSDGLDIETIVKLADYFQGRINVVFGWGTNLTNDLGLWTLSLVIKLMESCGFGTVKLSDNLDKAMANSQEDIDEMVRLCRYTNTFREECVV